MALCDDIFSSRMAGHDVAIKGNEQNKQLTPRSAMSDEQNIHRALKMLGKEMVRKRAYKPRAYRLLAAPAGSALSFDTLRAANTKRQLEWCPGLTPDLSFRGNELAGETGEACNIIKKLERERQGWRGSRATSEQLAEELADVVIVADLIAQEKGIDLGEAVRSKFNATSEKYGLTVKIARNASSPTAS